MVSEKQTLAVSCYKKGMTWRVTAAYIQRWEVYSMTPWMKALYTRIRSAAGGGLGSMENLRLVAGLEGQFGDMILLKHKDRLQLG